MRAILLPLTDPKLDRQSLRLSLNLATKLDGHVTALLPQSDFSSLPVYGHNPLAAGWDELIQHTHEHAERREVELRQVLRDVETTSPGSGEGPRLTLRVARGNNDEVVANCALTHDLILFPRQSEDSEDDLPTSSLLKSTLESAGRPILVVTDELPPDFPQTVTIAWNGSVESAHAVTAALPFLARAQSVHVLTLATSRTDASRAKDLVAYLSKHGASAEAHVQEPEVGVGQELLDLAMDLGADLLVMGGYTHSRLRQTLFGGVTHHVLEHATLPLLMAR